MIQEYNELFNVLWHTDSNGNKVSIQRLNEQHKVVNGKIILHEIPDEFYLVVINEMFEINNNEQINNANEFKVDYLTGCVTFHSSKEAQTITVNQYYGRGQIKSYAIRTLLQDANNNWTSTNIEDLAEEIKKYIDGRNISVDNQITNLQNQISTNESDIESKLSLHQNSSIAHTSSSINNTSNVTGSKVSDALNTLKTNHDEHLDSLIAHRDDAIVNSSNFNGVKLRDALNTIRTLTDSLQTQINNITVTGSIDPEVEQAHDSTVYSTNYSTIKDRFELIELKLKNVEKLILDVDDVNFDDTAIINALSAKAELDSAITQANQLKNDLASLNITVNITDDEKKRWNISYDKGIVITHNLNDYPFVHVVNNYSFGHGDYGDFAIDSKYQVMAKCEYLSENSIRIFLNEDFNGTPTVSGTGRVYFIYFTGETTPIQIILK